MFLVLLLFRFDRYCVVLFVLLFSCSDLLVLFACLFVCLFVGFVVFIRFQLFVLCCDVLLVCYLYVLVWNRESGWVYKLHTHLRSGREFC